MIHGIDVSSYQGEPNFDTLKSSVDFVLIKSSFGCPDPGQTVAQYRDPEFNRNESESRRVGLLRGFYHYCYPEVNDPKPEVDQFLNVVGVPLAGELLALDFEEPTTKDVVAWCKSFLDELSGRLNGYKPLLYIDQDRANKYDWSSVINAGYGLWLAQWDFNPDAPMNPNTPWPELAFRQYSDRETVGGVTPVDGDVFYGDMNAFMKYGYSTAQPAPSTTVTGSLVREGLYLTPDGTQHVLLALTDISQVSELGFTNVPFTVPTVSILDLVTKVMNLQADNADLQSKLSSVQAPKFGVTDLLALIVSLFTRNK